MLRACFDGANFSDYHFYQEQSKNVASGEEVTSLVDLLMIHTVTEEAVEAAAEVSGTSRVNLLKLVICLILIPSLKIVDVDSDLQQ